MVRLRKFLRFAKVVLLLLLPSRARVFCLRAFGNRVGIGCYLGFSIYDVEKITLGDHVYIGHGNVFKGLRELMMGSGSRIGNLNVFAGGGNGTFVIGKNSSISSGHYLDGIGDISIGSNTIIGGRRSCFFSHGITPENLDYRGKIEIGDWCYIGSNTKVAPGVKLCSHVFVGMGSVLRGVYVDEFVLLAGVPATVRKRYDPEAAFFDREEIVHRHRRR